MSQSIRLSSRANARDLGFLAALPKVIDFHALEEVRREFADRFHGRDSNGHKMTHFLASQALKQDVLDVSSPINDHHHEHVGARDPIDNAPWRA
ncbi:MAG: hypothetical protein ACREQV_23560, partial [Candidatus Binatia bacterium]